MKRFLPVIMLLMSGIAIGEARADITSRFASSVQLSVGGAHTSTNRIGSSFAVSGSGVDTSITPSGGSAAADQFLLGNDVPRSEYNSFGSRRGNHDVMVRGTFGNIRLRNKLNPDIEGDWTTHIPSGDSMRIYDAAERYREEKTPLIILAGKEYGTGSSRDWAAKGPMLLGVRAVIAESFERIHRSNLIGMGVLPLVFTNGNSANSLGLDGTESFDIIGVENSVDPGSKINITATKKSGDQIIFEVLCRIDTSIENEYYGNGGLLPYVLRQMLKDSSNN